jgi:hypothetical protein
MHSKWVGDCLIWTGALSKDGYGVIGIREGAGAPSRLKRVHRVAYELWVGPIPEGLTIDHVKARGCMSRACFNVEHLEPVTIGENIRRGDTGHYARSTQCKRGHEFAIFGRVQLKRDGSFKQRVCVECQRIASAEWEARRPKRDRSKRGK